MSEMRKVSGKQPTQNELDAIARFAAREGRRWKSILREEWMDACAGLMDDPDQSILQYIRNAYGPEWLVRYRLPKGRKVENLSTGLHEAAVR